MEFPYNEDLYNVWKIWKIVRILFLQNRIKLGCSDDLWPEMTFWTFCFMSGTPKPSKSAISVSDTWFRRGGTAPKSNIAKNRKVWFGPPNNARSPKFRFVFVNILVRAHVSGLLNSILSVYRADSALYLLNNAPKSSKTYQKCCFGQNSQIWGTPTPRWVDWSIWTNRTLS